MVRHVMRRPQLFMMLWSRAALGNMLYFSGLTFRISHFNCQAAAGSPGILTMKLTDTWKQELADRGNEKPWSTVQNHGRQRGTFWCCWSTYGTITLLDLRLEHWALLSLRLSKAVPLKSSRTSPSVMTPSSKGQLYMLHQIVVSNWYACQVVVSNDACKCYDLSYPCAVQVSNLRLLRPQRSALWRRYEAYLLQNLRIKPLTVVAQLGQITELPGSARSWNRTEGLGGDETIWTVSDESQVSQGNWTRIYKNCRSWNFLSNNRWKWLSLCQPQLQGFYVSWIETKQSNKHLDKNLIVRWHRLQGMDNLETQPMEHVGRMLMLKSRGTNPLMTTDRGCCWGAAEVPVVPPEVPQNPVAADAVIGKDGLFCKVKPQDKAVELLNSSQNVKNHQWKN